MTEEQIKKLRRMILLFILGIALILLGMMMAYGAFRRKKSLGETFHLRSGFFATM